jgi:hypothetical protein
MYLLSPYPGEPLPADSAAQCMASTAPVRGRQARKSFGVVQANVLLREKMAPWIQELQLVVEACSCFAWVIPCAGQRSWPVPIRQWQSRSWAGSVIFATLPRSR